MARRLRTIGLLCAPSIVGTGYETAVALHNDPKMRRFIPHELDDTIVRRAPWFLPEEYGHTREAALVGRRAGHTHVRH